MRFLGGAEIPFDADVELLGAALKPQPASESERRRLGQLAETEQLAEKVTCLSLAAGWCSKLHMVDSLKWVGLRHGARSVPSSIGTPADAEIVARLFLALWPDGTLAEHRAEAASILAGTPPSNLPLVVFVAEADAKVVGQIGPRSSVTGRFKTVPFRDTSARRPLLARTRYDTYSLHLGRRVSAERSRVPTSRQYVATLEARSLVPGLR